MKRYYKASTSCACTKNEITRKWIVNSFFIFYISKLLTYQSFAYIVCNMENLMWRILFNVVMNTAKSYFIWTWNFPELTFFYSDQGKDSFLMFPVSHPEVIWGHLVSSRDLRGRSVGRPRAELLWGFQWWSPFCWTNIRLK